MTITSTSFESPVTVSGLDRLTYGPMSLEQLRSEAAAGLVDGVMLITPDNGGRCLAERVPTDRFLEEYDNLGAFKVPLMLWGVDIEQNVRAGLDHVGGMGGGVPDVPLVPDLTTIRRLPWLPNTPVVICDPMHPDGSPVAFAPRQILKHQLERLEGLGATIQAATELEFYLFDESYEAAWNADHKGLTAASRYHAAYDAIAAIKAEPFVNEVIRQMDLAGIKVEGYAHEYGFGRGARGVLDHGTACRIRRAGHQGAGGARRGRLRRRRAQEVDHERPARRRDHAPRRHRPRRAAAPPRLHVPRGGEGAAGPARSPGSRSRRC